MIKVSRYNQAVAELTLAGIIWGGSFTLVRFALVDFPASVLIFWRLFLAFILGEVLLFFINRDLFRKSWSDARTSAPAGIFLGLSLWFQTYGLNFTTVTNSGFITSLYVVLIPIIGVLFFKQKIKLHHIILSLMAFAGMGFLLNLQDLRLHIGEMLTLACAFTAAFQIMFIGKVAKHTVSAFRFNTYQTFWSMITVLPFLLFETVVQKTEIWPKAVHPQSVLSLIALALLVSLLAFYLQVRAQRTLSTTTSSMLCLLEGPFAFIFAAFFLSESLDGLQLFGALLILTSCALSVFLDRPEPVFSAALHKLTTEPKQPE